MQPVSFPQQTSHEALGIGLATQLLEMATKADDATLHTAAKIIAEDPLGWDTHILTMTNLLVEQKRIMFDRLQEIVSKCGAPPVLVLREMPDIELSDGQIVAGEGPKTERGVIEASRVVYFRDFLRSLWRRLTARQLS